MKKTRYTEEQIAFALKQAQTGITVAEVIWRMGISEQTFYRWKKVYGGLGIGELRRLKQREDEKRKLKQLVADLCLDKQRSWQRMLSELRKGERITNVCYDHAAILIRPRLSGRRPVGIAAARSHRKSPEKAM